ncbi:ATP-dependent zinc metalloprotease FtsH [Clostridia bacterium]|nr:ATP-dependent zinc metalloprotease FtsH [Clostridia bacterium]
MRKDFLKGAGLYILMIVFILIVLQAVRTSEKPVQEPYIYSQLLADIAGKKVTRLEITGEAESSGAKVKVFLNDAATKELEVIDVDSFLRLANAANEEQGVQIDMKLAKSNTTFLQFLPIIVMVIVFIFILYMMSQQQSGTGGTGRGVMSFGRVRARHEPIGKPKVNFDSVAGLQEEKNELEEIVDFLKAPKKFTDIGARIPKGVLLVGPPGTGKTLLAKAVAGEAGVPFFSISGSDFVEMFVGVGASRVRDLFEQAKRNLPAIVFIDEIDAVGRRRGAGMGGGHDEREQTLNQLLVEMDGFGLNEGVIVVAATNRPDILDPALLRPGRFDRQVVVGKPDINEREQILKVHAIGKKLGISADLRVVAQTTPGFTGRPRSADSLNPLNEAALLAVREDKKEIDMNDLKKAFVKVDMGTEKKSRTIAKRERKITAYHEAGHAIIFEMLDLLDHVHIVSVIPTGMAGGYTMSLPHNDKSHISKKYMEQTIVSLLGGRAAESIALDDITTGASNDIERATNIARSMVTKYGMSENLGPIQFGDDNEEIFLGRDFGHTRNYSDDIAAQIDAEIKRIVEISYERASKILNDNIDILHTAAELLIQREKISGDEFRELFPEGRLVLKDFADDEQNPLITEKKEEIL